MHDGPLRTLRTCGAHDARRDDHKATLLEGGNQQRRAKMLVRNTIDLGAIEVKPLGLYVEGTEANDSLNGSSYADTMHGLGGNDVMSGGAGNDTMYGDAGNDWLDGGAGADQMIGGDGFDTVSYQSATLGVTFDVTTGGLTNDAQGDTYVGIEKFVGSNLGDIMNGAAGNDNFDGAAGDDFLFGNAGNDILNGGAGGDNLRGGDGDDNLNGGTGLDTLTGGDGFDTFVLTKNAGMDVVTDYTFGFDHLNFSGFGSAPFGSDGRMAFGYHDQSHGWITSNLDSTDQVFYDTHTGIMFNMNANMAYGMTHHNVVMAGIDEAALGIAQFTNHASLAVTDFHVV
jgi:Ca2+-binding RTX toxin-like protein